MAITTVKANVVLKEQMVVEAEVRGHTVILDEPEKLGGTDKGMTPGELLLSALGACQSMVARTFAKKFDINLKSFRVDLKGEIDPDGLTGESDVRPGFSTIWPTFHIETDASEASVNEFIKHLEAHCPMGDTILNAVDLKPAKVIIEK